jgi:F-type H+-transporting ATPase subunit b
LSPERPQQHDRRGRGLRATAQQTLFLTGFFAFILGLPVYVRADSWARVASIEGGHWSLGATSASLIRGTFPTIGGPTIGGPGISSPGLAALLMAPPEEPADEGKAETKELIYKTINFLLLVGGLIYLLRKPMGAFFAARSAEIREGVEEGRKALAESGARMSAIEEKLRHLEEEIAAFKASATREMQAEHERMRLATVAETEKMLESARSRMDITTRATKLELRLFVANEALKQAEQMIRGRLDDATRSRLVQQFVARVQ